MDQLLPSWCDKYSINNEHIDSEHKRLFELAAKVEAVAHSHVQKDDFKEILNDLFSYMKVHFVNEEDYMQKISYPYLNEHKIMHKDIVKGMSSLIQNIKTTNDLKEKLYIIVSEWLLDHILHHDMMIAYWLKESQQPKAESVNLDEDIFDYGDTVKVGQDDLAIKQPQFIYTCSCHTEHVLSYKEHMDIKFYKKNLRCKACQDDLSYLRTN